MVEARAPGRVNVIGEHTDYSGGFVMPCAIGYYTQATARLREAGEIAAESRATGWEPYVKGIAAELRNAGVRVPGADLQIAGNVPVGAGLSSSASLEISVALALLRLADAEMDPSALAKLAQRAENVYAGTQSGIMDQMAVLLAQRGCAMLLDTRSLAFAHVPLPREATLAICNTMVKHELATGAYNERRRQCEESARRLGVIELRDVNVAGLEKQRDRLTEVLYRRARHVVTENERVLSAADALRSNDLRHLGELMNASHESLRTDYEVSCEELDILAGLARAHPAAYGARMTGGGFGGCIVALVEAAGIAQFREYIVEAYRSATGIAPELYDGTPVDGAAAHE